MAILIEPVTLAGKHVRLEPLTLDHLDALHEIGRDPELWRWTPTGATTRAALEEYIEIALRERDQGNAVPFATIHLPSDRPVGSTRFAAIDRTNRRAEIGWTWVGAPWQRTAVNTEAKLLMLTQAFEVWRLIRVELKTDALNEKSRRAIERIGAVEEGTLRHHFITESGRLRDSVYYSILEAEWPGVKRTLEEKLASHS